ncbi:TonB-dependent receptor [Endozoicomonas arenosclerae]|uniref:TonB-dependent receptor n=1 Tax=Endozoicomonas arenosclerae TaxID=1633495 RepID=UPI000AF7F50D|nr:TonB-dependent receptor [Endozoicomonas arenosclerae]
MPSVNNDQSARQRNKARFKPAVLAMAIASVCAATSVQADGRLEGSYKVEASNIGLQGALVRIEELNLETTTARDGSFEFPPVKAGTYTLTVNYLGAETQSRKVVVTDNQLNTESFVLASSDKTEEVLVIGHASNINRALNRQRAADNIVSVVNADAIGQLPDANAAESLRRIPGVSVELDQGEGRKVSIRGLSPDLNSVTINGATVPSPDKGDRSVNLDVVSSDLLESLEVTKSITPDMDADSIGGSVNIKSLSAYDRDGFFYKLNAEGSKDDNTGDTSPKLAGTVSDIFSVGDGTDNLGVAAGISWQKRKFGSDNVETGGKWAFEDDGTAKLEEVELRDYQITRERLGATLNFDYKLNRDNELYLRTLYSEFKDTELRNSVTAEFDSPVSAGETGEIKEPKRELKDREEIQKIVSTVLGGTSRNDAWTIDYSVSYSHAEEKKPDATESAFESSSNFEGRFNDTKKPKITAVDGFYQASNYELKEVEVSDSKTTDKLYNFKLDITRDFDWNDNPAMVKFGGKISRRDKDADEDVLKYEDFPNPGMASFVKGNVDYSLGRFGPEINPSAVRSALGSAQEKEEDKEKSVIEDYTMQEDINAAYLMGRVDVEKWRFLTGVRYEGTDFTAEGYQFDKEPDEIATKRKVSKDYDHWLPALHARYRINDNTLVRAAWTHSVVRPTFEQARPGVLIDEDKAELGNPDLKPVESSNLDLGIEHYMGRAGVISAFVFYKDLENFIYSTDVAGTPGRYESFDEAKIALNGDSGHVYGLELAYSKQFSELPYPFNGLLINANATFADSKAEVEGAKDNKLVKRDIALPGQSDVTANLVLGYELDRLSLRLSTNYKSSYLDEVTRVSDKRFDLYVDDYTQMDFTASYQLTDELNVFFQAVNLTDEAFYKYTGKEKYNAQYEEYGTAWKLGVTLSNF